MLRNNDWFELIIGKFDNFFFFPRRWYEVYLILPTTEELKRETRGSQARVLLMGHEMFALNPEDCLKEITCFSSLIRLNYIMSIRNWKHHLTSERGNLQRTHLRQYCCHWKMATSWNSIQKNHVVKVEAFLGGQISTPLPWFWCDSLFYSSNLQSLVLTGYKIKDVCLLGFLIPS